MKLYNLMFPQTMDQNVKRYEVPLELIELDKGCRTRQG